MAEGWTRSRVAPQSGGPRSEVRLRLRLRRAKLSGHFQRYREAYWVRSGVLSFGKVWHRWLSEARLGLAGLLSDQVYMVPDATLWCAMLRNLTLRYALRR